MKHDVGDIWTERIRYTFTTPKHVEACETHWGIPTSGTTKRIMTKVIATREYHRGDNVYGQPAQATHDAEPGEEVLAVLVGNPAGLLADEIEVLEELL